MKEKEKLLVYVDTSVFAGKVLLKDEEDKKSSLLIRRISANKFNNFKFVTSKFTLVELGELISRKKTKNKAKTVLFDIMYNSKLPIFLLNPEDPHKEFKKKEYFEIDLLIKNFVNTALDFNIPGFDTIHAHTVKTIDQNIIAVSKDNHFRRFNKIKNVSEVLKPSQFLIKYS